VSSFLFYFVRLYDWILYKFNLLILMNNFGHYFIFLVRAYDWIPH
jgi:hypothetical protein